MFIADIAYERPDAPEGKRWVRFGSLWVDHGKARLKLTGVHLGSFCGRLKAECEPQYVAGDLVVVTGSMLGPGKTEEQWIGHIQTADETGVVYFGDIEVVPCKLGEPLWVLVRE